MGSFLMQYVILKALLPVCLKYTARDESRVTNIVPGKDICHKTLIKSYILSYKQSGSISVLLYFTLVNKIQFLPF